MTMMSLKHSDTAVTQTLGFVLIASLMTISFMIIFAVGYPAYNNYVESGHMRNMEESFDIVSYNGNNVAMNKNPYSSSEMKIYGGVLATRDVGYMNISYYDSGSGPIPVYNNILNALEYFKNGVRIAYVDGSVCRSTGEYSVMLKDPLIYVNGDTLVITQITLYDSNVSKGGNGLARVYFYTPYYSKMVQTITYPPVFLQHNVNRVDVNLSGDYKDSFGRYFRDECGFTMTENANGEITVSKAFPGGIDLYVSQSLLMVEVG